MKQYVCTICGYVYDEAAGARWEDLPEDWVCPLCGAAKSDFVEQGQLQPAGDSVSKPAAQEEETELRQLTTGELAALCSNLARGCEKQYLAEESALFRQLADYFTAKTPPAKKTDAAALLALVKQDLEELLPAANTAAGAQPDRGALRALVWNEKVSRMLHSLLARYQKDGGAFLEDTNVFVCTICGFVYVGDAPPALCPVCKVPDWKFQQVERRAAL